MRRREFVTSLVTGGVLLERGKTLAQFRVKPRIEKSFDVAVIGAGVFGAWTAHRLQQSGKKVILLDAYGAANSRASSGGESRIIRMGYGADEIYTRWSRRSLELWQDLFRSAGQPLFHPTGVLWMAREKDSYAQDSLATLQKLGIPFKRLGRDDLEREFPQISFGAVRWGILEPQSGVLLARRSVQAVVQESFKQGLEFRREAVAPLQLRARLESLKTQSGGSIYAGDYVFACGPWLPKIFPDILRDRIQSTRQEVFFFGMPPGTDRFAPPSLPAWIDFGDEIYGIPDLENRGFKIAPDRHGPAFDPDLGNRDVLEKSVAAVRTYLAQRFPDLKDAPLLETRVCQYENTSNGDFLIDRHPGARNVWLVGGGSGHGFKHGPALGEYVTARLLEGGDVDPRFSLAAKKTVSKRSVF